MYFVDRRSRSRSNEDSTKHNSGKADVNEYEELGFREGAVRAQVDLLRAFPCVGSILIRKYCDAAKLSDRRNLAKLKFMNVGGSTP